MTMWIMLSLAALSTSFFLCTSAIHSSRNSYPNYESQNPRSTHKSSLSDSRRIQSEGDNSNYLYDISDNESLREKSSPPGDLLDLWPVRDAATTSRQYYGATVSDLIGSDADESSRMVFDDEEDNDLANLPKDKRESHSLSIVNPLDVLRQRLMLEMARRKMQENQERIRANDVILKSLGKRSSLVQDHAMIQNTNGGKVGSSGQRTKQNYLRNQQVYASDNFDI